MRSRATLRRTTRQSARSFTASIGSAPDEDGNFELQRATRHVGEPPSADYLAPVRRTEEPLDQARNNGPAQASRPEPVRGYAQFLDDIVSAAQRFGYRADASPGPGDPRLRGLRQ